MFDTVIRGQLPQQDFMHLSADNFPTINPVHWLTSHFAVGGYSPLQRLSGMLTAHMTQIKPQNGFAWHQHRGLEIYTYVIDGELYHEDSTGGKGTIGAGEVQRMFSGNYIQHKELNRTDEYTRVIQIWYAADTQYRGLEPNYEQVPLEKMPPRTIGDGVVRDIIGDDKGKGATDSHVNGRLTSTIIPAGGRSTFELPREGEDLFLYVVNGSGIANGSILPTPLGLYDVALATPNATAPTFTAGDQPLNYLSFYLPSFIESQ
ncbi:MAG: redox-sensitive bicupin YhaK (pirin superfamily) [Cellvibrionaceae bacterium]|jgi:redox-sensitive bicupin YhaK (pirin superfamily)